MSGIGYGENSVQYSGVKAGITNIIASKDEIASARVEVELPDPSHWAIVITNVSSYPDIPKSSVTDVTQSGFTIKLLRPDSQNQAIYWVAAYFGGNNLNI